MGQEFSFLGTDQTLFLCHVRISYGRFILSTDQYFKKVMVNQLNLFVTILIDMGINIHSIYSIDYNLIQVLYE